jgi:hypothetical protein
VQGKWYFKDVNEIVSCFVRFHLILLKFGMGDVCRNLSSGCEFRWNLHHESRKLLYLAT